jgi:hypothetical protein
MQIPNVSHVQEIETTVGQSDRMSVVPPFLYEALQLLSRNDLFGEISQSFLRVFNCLD